MRIKLGQWVFTRWYLPCGCPHHGDHLACEDVCWDFGCKQAMGHQETRWGRSK